MAYSLRKMAQALGVSKSQVDRDAKAGMPMDDVAAARVWRLAHQDLTRTAEGRIDRPGPRLDRPERPAHDDPDDDPPPAGATDEDTAVYRAERAKREGIRREREQLALQQERNELVAVQEVARLQFTAMRLTRDRVEMVPARVAADLLTLVHSGGDAFAVERLLAQQLRQALDDAARAIEDIDDDEDPPD